MPTKIPSIKVLSLDVMVVCAPATCCCYRGRAVRAASGGGGQRGRRVWRPCSRSCSAARERINKAEVVFV